MRKNLKNLMKIQIWKSTNPNKKQTDREKEILKWKNAEIYLYTFAKCMFVKVIQILLFCHF